MDRLDRKSLVVFVLTIALFMIFTSAASAELVYINDTIVDSGDSITVPILIYVTDPSGLGAATIDLHYNSSVVNVTSVSDSDFDVFTPNIQNSSSYTRIVTSRSTEFGVGPGTIQFANVTLQSVGAAGDSSLMSFSVITLSNNTGQPLYYSISNGTFTVGLPQNGDINGDGSKSTVDGIYLAKHVLGFSGYGIIYADGDINGDGSKSTVDGIYLAKHVLGFSGYEVIY